MGAGFNDDAHLISPTPFPARDHPTCCLAQCRFTSRVLSDYDDMRLAGLTCPCTRPVSGDAQLTPPCKSNGAIQFEIGSTVKMTSLIEMIWAAGITATNFCRLRLRLKRSMARSRRRNDCWEFSVVLSNQRPASCLPCFPVSFIAEPWERSSSATIMRDWHT